jgi:hypothetical protein
MPESDLLLQLKVVRDNYASQDGRSIEDSELENMVLYLKAKDPRERSDDDFEVDPDDLDPIEAEPMTPLADAIPDKGWLREFVTYTSSTSMIAPEFAIAAGLMVMSAIAQESIANPLPPGDWGSALWAVLVAQPGQKKSAAVTAAERFLSRIMGGNKLSNAITAEKLIGVLGENRSRWLVHSEFSNFMTQADKPYMAGVMETLNDCYDGNRPVVDRDTMGQGRQQAKYPTVAILGATTYSSLAQWAATAAIERGFLTRIMFVPQDESTEYRGAAPVADGRGTRDREESLIAELEEIRSMVNRVPSFHTTGSPLQTVDYSEEAAEIINRYDARWTVDDTLVSALSGFAQRIGSNTWRLAIAYALARSSMRIEGGDARQAVAFSEFCRTRSWRLIQTYFSTDTFQAKNIVRLTITLDSLGKQAPDGWVSVTRVKKRSGLHGRVWEEAIEFLVHGTGEVQERAQERADGRPGRPKLQYRLRRHG